MRNRTKNCFKCREPKEVLYRCRYQELKGWVFLCGKCLHLVKEKYENTYQYGGTWKSKKSWLFEFGLRNRLLLLEKKLFESFKIRLHYFNVYFWSINNSCHSYKKFIATGCRKSVNYCLLVNGIPMTEKEISFS